MTMDLADKARYVLQNRPETVARDSDLPIYMSVLTDMNRKKLETKKEEKEEKK